VPAESPPTAAARVFRFGESALATPANALTLARLLLAVPTLVLIEDQGAAWLTVVLWVILSLTDGVDGWVARRDGTTRSGAFLDPLADKALVLGAMWAIVAAGGFWWLPVLLITGRELGISVFRSYWGRRGLAVPASFWAKVKTVVQSVAVGLALAPTLEDAGVPGAMLWVAAALTLGTGAQYVFEGSRATTAGGARA
jgi:CDP-diacylglycerol--glycerol-3-phosphate 3-phosphatidyltransferase